MITTTLNRILDHGPCDAGWETLLAGLGKTAADDEPLPFSWIIEINGLNDALWCCRAEPQYARKWRFFAVWCARQVQHLMEDSRFIAVLDVAERYARGEATEKELQKAAAVAAEAKAALDAAGRPKAAVWAATAALAAAKAPWAKAAAWAAAATGQAARDQMRAKQTAEFLRIVTETEARS